MTDIAGLTKAQRYWLRNFVHGWTIANPDSEIAPIRRLIRRGLISKTGVSRGRPYFKITEAGHRALSSGDAS